MGFDRTNRPLWLRCAVAVFITIFAATIRWQFLGVLELRAAFLTFYPAVAVAALYGGFSAGLLATVISAALADYFWMEPVSQFAITNVADLISLVVFLASGTLISYMAEVTHRAQARANKAEEESRLASEREKATIALKESEERFRLFVEEVRDYAIFMLDNEGRVVSWNTGAEQIKGYRADEIIGRHMSCFYTPEDITREWPLHLLQKAEVEGRWEDEGWRVRKGGSRFWASMSITALHDKNGRPQGFFKVTRDITERKQAEEQLRERRQWLQVTLASIGDGVLSTDTEGTVTFINPVAAALTGRTIEEAVGQPVQSIFRIINEKTRAPADDIVERVLREGNVVALANHTALITPDGREISIEDSAAPIKDSKGNVSGVVLVFHDVTGKRRAQEALQESERFQRLIAETSEFGLRLLNIGELIEAVSERVAKEFNASRCGFSLVDVEAGQITVINDYHGDFPSIAGVYPIAEFAEHWKKDGLAGWVGSVEDIVTDTRTAMLYETAFEPIQVRAHLTVPLHRDGKWVANFWLSHHEPRHWTARETELMKLLSERLWGNVERERAQDALRESEERFRVMANSMPQLAWIAEADGYIFWYNQRWYEYTGTTPEQMEGWGWQSVHDPDALPGVLERWKESIAAAKPFDMVFPLRGADGSFREFLTRVEPVRNANGNVIKWCGTNTDITERKRTEMEREVTVEILKIVNQSSGLDDVVKAATTFFQRESGCEAVGIRLNEGEDFPYFEARGFPEEFVRLENSLCAKDAMGNIIRDSLGDPVIECMCGNVILERVDPSKPFFSPGGSFWANSTTRLLASNSDEDRQTKTRNRCNGEGYESVALIPLRLGTERLGLIQLNDRRQNMFSPEIIALWERLADHLAVAIAKSRTDKKIEHQNAVLETINQILYTTLTGEPEEELGIACLMVAEELTESKFGFLGEVGSDGLLHDIAISDPGWKLCAMYDQSGHRRPPGDFKLHGLYGRVLLDGESLLTNDPSSHPDSIGTPEGHPPLTAFLGVPLMQEGKTIGMVGLGNREGGYTLKHRQAMEAIAPAIAEALLRKRAESCLTADLNALTRMHALSVRLLETGGIQSLLQEIMDSAVMIVGAEMGTLQLLEDDSLRIVAAHGHQQQFLDFFASAESQASVCGEATKRGDRVVVSDVETSSLFIGTPSLAVLREAGVRAVQSTPIMSRDGALLGILTTQWGVPYTPDEHDLWRIDLLVRQAADLIEHSKSEEALLKSRDELELRVLERTAELKSYMAKLEQSNQALQDFASIAAHDLKEPLRKVISFGDMLRQKSGGSMGQSGNDYLNRMLNATERMQSLLTGLLDYSRVATTAEPFKEVNLSDLIGEVLSDLEVRIVKTVGEVRVETLPVISADPTQMRQLFQNLIGNALKFHKAGEKPIVKVSCIPENNGVAQIIVEDNGIGFEEQYLEKIFAPFQRLHGKSSQYEGTGMGLAICKKIVERHGGTITAKSIPGKGSTFTITLPL